ncbi:hypothetical protein CWO90_27495 [Bradyrhizobium sp. Leo121]|nr:hypothetical protein CWO90_27495 [Bradyrhizobium sp. Leo121]
MPGLVPGIHVFLWCRRHVDGRDKPGHDGESVYNSLLGPAGRWPPSAISATAARAAAGVTSC